MLTPLPATWTATRVELHRVAVHVLARRRSELVGKIGLRATPGGIATAAAGPEHEVVRTSGAWLLCERTGVTASTRSLHLAGATLAEAAAGRTNLGVSPGDAGHPDPYLYVGPWGPDRATMLTGTRRSAPCSAVPTCRRPATRMPRRWPSYAAASISRRG